MLMAHYELQIASMRLQDGYMIISILQLKSHYLVAWILGIQNLGQCEHSEFVCPQKGIQRAEI